MTPAPRMTRPPQTVDDVVDQLSAEFDGRVPLQNAAEVIVRLSANGAVSLPVLAYLARQHLERLAGAGTGDEQVSRA